MFESLEILDAAFKDGLEGFARDVGVHPVAGALAVTHLAEHAAVGAGYALHGQHGAVGL